MAFSVGVGWGQDRGGEASWQQGFQPQVSDCDLAAVAVDVDLVAPQVSMDDGRILAVQIVQTQQHLPCPPLRMSHIKGQVRYICVLGQAKKIS